jgi:hypothetical protein
VDRPLGRSPAGSLANRWRRAVVKVGAFWTRTDEEGLRSRLAEMRPPVRVGARPSGRARARPKQAKVQR